MLKYLLLISILTLAACRATGAEVTNTLDVSYPNADAVSVSLELNNGQLQVEPSGSSGLTGSVTTNVDRWQPQIDSSGDSITVRQGEISASVIPQSINRWDIALADGTALDLNVSSGSADAELNLGGLQVTNLIADSDDGSYTVTYGSPHPSDDGGAAQFALNTGSLTINSLLNARLRELEVTGNSGDVILDFTGEPLTQNMDVNLELTSGDVRINSLETVPMQVVFRSSSGRIQDEDPQFAVVNETTRTLGDYDSTTAPRVNIAVRTTAGHLRLAID